MVAATAATWRFTGSPDDAPTRSPAAVAAAAPLVVVDGPTASGSVRVIRAAHPLLSAAAYNGLTDSRRRALHDRFSRVADDPVERVRHLALAAVAPRADVAEALDAGA